MNRIWNANNQKMRRKIIICYFLIYLVLIITMPMIVEIKNPQNNIGIYKMQGDQPVTLEAKRQSDDTVYANEPIILYKGNGIRITMICNIGDNIQINRVCLRIGDFTAKIFSDITENENIQINDMELVGLQDGVYTFEITGSNPYIQINFIWHLVILTVIINMLFLAFIAGMFLYIMCWICKEVERLTDDRKKSNEKGIKKNIGIICGIIIGAFYFLIYKNFMHIEMYHAMETWFLLIALGILYLLLYMSFPNRKYVCVSIMASCPLLCISVWNLTTYLTRDERQHIMEQYFLQNPILTHWQGNSSHLNYAIMGTIWNFVPNYLVDVLSYEQIGKLLHWLCGIVLIYIIGFIIVKKILNYHKINNSIISYYVVINFLLCIPTVVQTLKNYNYDLFSLMFSIIAILLLYICVKKKKSKWGLVAICISATAIAEKSTALLVWLVCCVVYVAESVCNYQGRKCLKMIRSTFLSILLSIFAIFMLQVYVMDMLLEVRPYNNIFDTIYLITDIISPGTSVFMKLLKCEMSLNAQVAFTFLGLFVGILIAAAVYIGVKKNYEKKKKIIYLLINGTALFLLILGIVSCFSRDIDATVSRWDFARFLLSEYVKGFPTFFLIIAIVVLIKGILRHNNGLHLMASGNIIIMTTFYTIANQSIFATVRYQVIYLVIFIVLVMIICLEKIDFTLHYKRKLMVTMLILVFEGTEIISSLPAFTTYLPYWYMPIARQDKWGVYAYWGECNSIAGNQIVEYCLQNRIDIDNIMICDSYLGAWHGGEWLTNKYDILLQWHDGYSGWVSMGFSNPNENQFFIFETQTLKRGELKYGLPKNEKPIITLTYRGIPTARVYRGDQLVDYFSQYPMQE